MSPPGVVLTIALSIALLSWILRISRLRAAKSAPIAWRGLLQLPMRYLRDVHAIVDRDKRASRMHMLTAGGFVAGTALTILVFVADVSSRTLAFGVAASGVLMLIGSAFVWARRVPVRPPHLSGGAYNMLPPAITCFALFLLLVSMPQLGVAAPPQIASALDLLTIAFGTAGSALLIATAAHGPMRHAVAGALHLSFHPRQLRFERSTPDAALQLLDLNAARLGVQDIRDLDWRRWLAFDACVQCGRCEVACPAFAAGAPLNPKKLIFDLWSATQGGAAAAYAGSPHPGRQSRTVAHVPGQGLVGPTALIEPDTIWACTTCRACVEECPMMIEHVDAIVDLRRGETLEQGRAPGKVPETLESLEVTETACGKGPGRRLDWAVDLALPLARERRSFDVLLWLGEGSFQPRGQSALRALVKLLRHASVDFAVLGEEESDCGDLARRLGDEYLFRKLAERTIATLARYRFGSILTCDPHVLHCLRNEYPALGAAYEVVHHTTFLDGLAAQKQLRFRKDSGQHYTYHDPCYLGRYNGEFEAPRRLLGALATEVHEMERSRSRSFCCGGGGGAAIADVEQKRRIPDLRMEQACATGAQSVVVACPNCALMLEGAAGRRLAVVDIAELAAQLVDTSESSAPAFLLPMTGKESPR